MSDRRTCGCLVAYGLVRLVVALVPASLDLCHSNLAEAVYEPHSEDQNEGAQYTLEEILLPPPSDIAAGVRLRASASILYIRPPPLLTLCSIRSNSCFQH